jgi:probable phosphoglycerate mutase
LAQAPLEGARFLGDGEVFVDAVGRITGSFDVILRTVAGGAALVVAHEGVNRLALGWATGGGLAAATTFEQDLGCLNILDFDVDEDFTITRVIVKAVNVLPRDPCLRSDRRTSVESLFQLQAGTIRREAVGKG